MERLRISAVSYSNTIPFVYGIERSGFLDNYSLELDVPSVCAQKLIEDKVDIGLIPVAMIPKIITPFIISDYCIGSNGAVNSVLLVSDKPLEMIKKIYLDFESRTSVQLVRVLAKHYWKIDVEWKALDKEESINFSELEAVVIIGDKCFDLVNNFKYVYDLSYEWQKFSSLPFVFACWVANKKIPENVKKQFYEALKFGVENIDRAIENISSKINLYNYLTKNISYTFDKPKRQAMDLFLKYL
jgi:chorismate dehydratase